MFFKLQAFTNILEKKGKRLDLTAPNWQKELTEDLKCFSEKIFFNASSKQVSIESISLSLQIAISDLALSRIDKVERYLIFGGSGFSGKLRGLAIGPQDSLYLQLYNGFCGACDFDVDCWKAKVVLAGTPEIKEVSIGIRS